MKNSLRLFYESDAERADLLAVIKELLEDRDSIKVFCLEGRLILTGDKMTLDALNSKL